MRMRKVFSMLTVAMLLFSYAMPTNAQILVPGTSIMANSMFDGASVSLSTSMTAKFDADLTKSATVTVSVTLEKKVGTTWQGAGSLTSPSSKTGVVYSTTKDYSQSCTKGNTYRIVAVFTANKESVTRTSNSVAY